MSMNGKDSFQLLALSAGSLRIPLKVFERSKT